MTATHASPRHAALGTVFVVAQHLDRLGDVVLAPLGLTTKQWLLLAVVHRAFPGRCPTLSEAAAVYGSSRQNVKVIASALAERGYVRLIDDPLDRRAVRLQVTYKAWVFSTRQWAAPERAFFDRLFGGLDPAQLSGLLDLVSRWTRIVASQISDSMEERSR